MQNENGYIIECKILSTYVIDLDFEAVFSHFLSLTQEPDFL